jgi:murein DD-endopeptidase MepM/ murein hydrolase activator NlpD
MTRARPFAATCASALLVLHTTGRTPAQPRIAAQPDQDVAATLACPAGTIPDEGVCVHLEAEGPDAPIEKAAHRERSGRWNVYDQIPRRPERPADYDAYRYPVPPGLVGGHSVLSGYDLDRPDTEQRRGRKIRAVGHGGVDLPQAKGTPIHMLRLEHQEGDADVLYTGPLFGTTVVTHHVLREAGELRDYILLFGHLDGWPPNVKPGVVLHDGDVVGFVGDTGSPELVHLHLEARRVRDGVDVRAHAGPEIVSDAISIACDPRNVLPLK